MSLEKDRQLGLGDATGCDSRDEVAERAGIGAQGQPVQPEEGDGGDQPGPLVAVDEGVIADAVEQVGTGSVTRRGA